MPRRLRLCIATVHLVSCITSLRLWLLTPQEGKSEMYCVKPAFTAAIATLKKAATWMSFIVRAWTMKLLQNIVCTRSGEGPESVGICCSFNLENWRDSEVTSELLSPSTTAADHRLFSGPHIPQGVVDSGEASDESFALQLPIMINIWNGYSSSGSLLQTLPRKIVTKSFEYEDDVTSASVGQQRKTGLLTMHSKTGYFVVGESFVSTERNELLEVGEWRVSIYLRRYS